MNGRKVNSPEKALAYITDCTLATVGTMAGLKKKSKAEYGRQKRIAQKGVDWLVAYANPDDYKDTRVDTVVSKFNQSVDEYSEYWESF